MGQGEKEIFEKKMSKEEKKAASAAKRAAKSAAKLAAKGGPEPVKEEEVDKAAEALKAVELAERQANATSEEAKRDLALEKLHEDHIQVTYAASKRKIAATDKDINVSDVSITFHGKPLVEGTDVVINYGNR